VKVGEIEEISPEKAYNASLHAAGYRPSLPVFQVGKGLEESQKEQI